MTTPGFVHLHTHSEHSPLDGLIRPYDGVTKVAADGQTALAFTDHGTLSGAWRFAQAARRSGVKPIIGIEGYLAVADDWTQEPSRFEPGSVEVENDDEDVDVDTDKGTKKKHYNHITLLAATPEGWANLVAMGNASNETFRRHPLMDFELMKKHGAGIIALTGCIGGPVMGPVSRGHLDEARLNIRRLIDCFGPENVYVELMKHGIAAESDALPTLVELAAEFDLKLVATNDAHYTNADDAPIHEGLLAMQSGKTLTDPTRFHFHGEGYHLRTEAEMRALRDEPWWQEACSNSVVIADRCADVVPEPQMRLPRFPLPEGQTDPRKYLVELVKAGAAERYGDPLPAEVTARLNAEMKVIADAGFVDYFLIVWDVIKRARERGIRVGPGRGSAAGCAISYCLGIVAVDPLENNLLFERFLEPGRAGMPDIDVDFEKGRRGEVLDMLVETYGVDRVARIGSFQSKKSRGVLRGAAKVLGLTGVGDQLARAVPIGDGGQPFSFRQLLDESQQAGELFRTRLKAAGEDGERILHLARGIEGAVTGESIHACGTLISDASLTDLVPLRTDRSKAKVAGLDAVTQWDGVDIDAFGLLKLDVLGLRNLDVVSLAAQMIFDTTGEVVDPDKLPHPNTKGDPRVEATWELLRSGRTAGVFQMESSGMANLARDVAPDSLGDLSAVVALYRPGPMSAGMHQMYADRKNGHQQVDYSIFTHDPDEQAAIAEVLGETYGVFVYQEQLMRLGTVVAGFDVKMRSKLRKAVGKKIPALMAEVGEAFVAGAEAEHYDETTGALISRRFQKSTAEKLFDYMKGSADYLFNASHSFAYAQLAYVTAYLKANWPSAYGAAILAATDQDDKRLAALRALREEGITVLAPDINRSKATTSPLDDKTVLLGLTEIKDVGSVGHLIVAARELHEEFTDLHDVFKYVLTDRGTGALNVAQAEALIESGAMDAFGPRKGLMSVVRASQKVSVPVPDQEWGVLERSSRQRQKLGAIMGEHPMVALGDQVSRWRTPTVVASKGEIPGRRVEPLSTIPAEQGASVVVAAILAGWAERGYKGGRMANFTLESETESISGVAWDRTVSTMHAANLIPRVGDIVAVYGRVELKTWETEGDEGEIVENTTKELMAQQMWTVDVHDVGSPFHPQPMDTHLAALLPTEVQPEPERPAEPTAPADEPAWEGPIEDRTPPPLDPEEEWEAAAYAADEEDDAEPTLPVFVAQANKIGTATTAATEHSELLRVVRGRQAKFEPPIGRGQASIHAVIVDKITAGWLVVVPPKSSLDAPAYVPAAITPTWADFGMAEPAAPAPRAPRGRPGARVPAPAAEPAVQAVQVVQADVDTPEPTVSAAPAVEAVQPVQAVHPVVDTPAVELSPAALVPSASPSSVDDDDFLLIHEEF